MKLPMMKPKHSSDVSEDECIEIGEDEDEKIYSSDPESPGSRSSSPPPTKKFKSLEQERPNYKRNPLCNKEDKDEIIYSSDPESPGSRSSSPPPAKKNKSLEQERPNYKRCNICNIILGENTFYILDMYQT